MTPFLELYIPFVLGFFFLLITAYRPLNRRTVPSFSFLFLGRLWPLMSYFFFYSCLFLGNVNWSLFNNHCKSLKSSYCQTFVFFYLSFPGSSLLWYIQIFCQKKKNCHVKLFSYGIPGYTITRCTTLMSCSVEGTTTDSSVVLLHW